MRKTSLFALVSVLLFTAIGFASCSNDDDENGGQHGSINKDVVGVWYDGVTTEQDQLSMTQTLTAREGEGLLLTQTSIYQSIQL